MNKRFILLLGETSREQNTSFLTAIKQKQFNWWHWLQDSWLLVDPTGAMASDELRDLANHHFPGVYKIVIELRGDGSEGWAGFGPNVAGKDMFKWIQENWKREWP